MVTTREEQAQYYVKHRSEFVGEAGHKKLLERLVPLMPVLHKKTLALDIGANKGVEWPLMDRILTEADGRILAFEPNPVNLPLLRASATAAKRQIEVFPVALSDKEDRAPLFCWRDKPENTPGYSLAGLRAGGAAIGEVLVRPVDHILADFPEEEWDVKYMKIDTEGNDTLVLRGCRRNLGRVHYILFEASDCLDDFRGPGETEPLRKCVEMLDAAGFDVYRIGTQRLLRLNGEMWDSVYERVKFWSNCFACRKGDRAMAAVIDEEGYFR